jgi:hypothetical protein
MNLKSVPKTTLTLSEPVAKTLKVYTAKTKSSMRAQSEVVEEALKEFFQRHNVKIEEWRKYCDNIEGKKVHYAYELFQEIAESVMTLKDGKSNDPRW